MTRTLFALLLSVNLLSGCSLFGAKDNLQPPASLKSFDKRVDLHALWSHSTGDGTDKQLLQLVPSVSEQRVYAADRNGSVWAFELDSGKVIWHQKTGIALSAGPGANEGLVLVGSSEGKLVALDAGNGKSHWRDDVPSEILSVPRVYEGVVIVQTVDGAISAMDADSGKQLWIYDRTVPILTLRGTSTPVVEDGVVIAGFANGKIVALDVMTGRELWEAAVTVPHGRTELQRMVDIDARAVVKDGVLYVCSYQGRLVAISLQDGHMLWNREMSSYAGIAADRSEVFVSDTESDVWALDRHNGGTLWKQAELSHRSLTRPAVIDDYVVVGDYAGYIHLLSRTDGSVAGRIRVDSDGIQAAPVALPDDRLLVLGAGGKLALYQLRFSK